MTDKKSLGAQVTNQAYIRYDQVEKRQEYHLAEAGHREAFDEDFRVRACDIGRFLHGDDTDKRRFASELGMALREIGFAILEGHGIDTRLYDDAEANVMRLFETLPLAEKLRFRAQRHGSVNQGYFPIKETTDIHPDLVEGWVFCRRAFEMGDGPGARFADLWPLPEQEAVFRRVCLAHERLILPVMQSILRDLGCDPHLYDRKLTRTNFGQRLNYYPRVSQDDAAAGAGRLLGHEDVDLFTFLPAPKVEGLQVLNRSNMKWVRLQAPPDSIILNTGDYMQRISNDILPSTTHRVSLPSDPESRNQTRVSLPMAIYVWEDEVLEVLPGTGAPKYEPIPALTFHTRITSKYYGDDYAVEAPRA